MPPLSIQLDWFFQPMRFASRRKGSCSTTAQKGSRRPNTLSLLAREIHPLPHLRCHPRTPPPNNLYRPAAPPHPVPGPPMAASHHSLPLSLLVLTSLPLAPVASCCCCFVALAAPARSGTGATDTHTGQPDLAVVEPDP